MKGMDITEPVLHSRREVSVRSHPRRTGWVPSGPRTELASLRELGGMGGPCYQAKHGAERRERGASHQATAACHPPGLIQCPVSSAWSLPCLQRSVLRGVRCARVTQYGYRVHRGGGAGPRLGSLGQPPILQLNPAWLSPGIRSLLMREPV